MPYKYNKYNNLPMRVNRGFYWSTEYPKMNFTGNGFTTHNEPDLYDPDAFILNGYKRRPEQLYNNLQHIDTNARYGVEDAEGNIYEFKTPYHGADFANKNKYGAVSEFLNRARNGLNTVKEMTVKDASFDPRMSPYIRMRYDNEKQGTFLLGSYFPGFHTIVYRDQYTPKDVKIHERMHAIDPISGNDQILGNINLLPGVEPNPYLDQPKEIKARLMQFRFDHKIDPTHKYNLFEIQNLRKNSKSPGWYDITNRYDDNTMLHLLNNVAQNTPTKKETDEHRA